MGRILLRAAFEVMRLPQNPIITPQSHPSLGSNINCADRGRVCELLGPAIFEDAGATHLLYPIAGESGIAIVELQAVNTEQERRQK